MPIWRGWQKRLINNKILETRLKGLVFLIKQLVTMRITLGTIAVSTAVFTAATSAIVMVPRFQLFIYKFQEMPKTIFITESQIKYFLNEDLKEKDVKKIAKDEVLDIIKKDKDFEKKVKSIVADSIRTLYKTLWQKSNLYDGDIRK